MKDADHEVATRHLKTTRLLVNQVQQDVMAKHAFKAAFFVEIIIELRLVAMCLKATSWCNNH